MPTTRHGTSHLPRSDRRRRRILWPQHRQRWKKSTGLMRRWPVGRHRASIRLACATAALRRRQASALRRMRGNDTVPPMSDYDVDFFAWTQRQGALLRRLATGERVNDADLDWPNIAEEIETLGRSERGAVASCIRNIIQHLMKLEASPARDPHPGWRATIRRERVDLEALLDDNPSLRPAVDGLIVRELPR